MRESNTGMSFAFVAPIQHSCGHNNRRHDNSASSLLGYSCSAPITSKEARAMYVTFEDDSSCLVLKLCRKTRIGSMLTLL